MLYRLCPIRPRCIGYVTHIRPWKTQPAGGAWWSVLDNPTSACVQPRELHHLLRFALLPREVLRVAPQEESLWAGYVAQGMRASAVLLQVEVSLCQQEHLLLLLVAPSVGGRGHRLGVRRVNAPLAPAMMRWRGGSNEERGQGGQ
eukprot:7260535-Pyramimonas_sp.AAC.1